MLNFLLFIFFLLVLSSFVSASSLFFCDTSENATFLMDINNQSNANDFDWTTYAYSNTDWTGGEDSITETFILKYPDTALNVNWTNQWEKVSKDTYDWYVWNYTKNDWQLLQHWDEFQMAGVIYNSSFNLSWTDHIQNNIIRVKVGLWSTIFPPYSAYSQARSYESAINYFTTVNFPSTPTVFFPKRGIYYDNISYINFTSTDVESSSLTYKIYINGALNITTTTNVTKWNASNGYYRMDISASDGTYTGYNYTTYFGIALDTTPPTFSLNSTNVSLTTYNGTTVQINLTITDSTAVDFYIFTHNDTTDGSWLNDTLIDAGWVYSITMVWNRTIGNFSASGGTFGWKVWANDTLNNIAYSDTYTFIVQNKDFTPLSACGNLNITNQEYQLQNNVNTTGTCFNVTANNITLDCKGYEVNYSSDGSLGYGVYSNQNFTTIKNCVIKEGIAMTNFKYAVYFKNAKNGTMNNNAITTSGNYSEGIHLSSSSSNLVFNNTITTSGDRYGLGIYLYLNSNLSIISNNTITTNGNDSHGIYLYKSSSNTLFNNTFNTSGDDSNGIGLTTNSNSNVLTTNTITTSGNNYGIYLYSSSNSNTISNNTITTSGNSAPSIRLELNSNSNTISNNTITTSGTYGIGISFTIVFYNNISNNIITTSNSNSNGIYSVKTTDSIISNNTITTSGVSADGIRVSGTNFTIVTGNTIITSGNSAVGIMSDSNTNSNTISNNTITTSGSYGYGIDVITNSNSNIISGNIITTSGNIGYGMYFYSNSNSNTISGNTIITYNSSGTGINLQGSTSNNFSNNAITTFGSNAQGIYFEGNPNNNSFSKMNINTNSSNAIYIYDTEQTLTMEDSILNSSLAPELYINQWVSGGVWNFTNVTQSNRSVIAINRTEGASSTGTKGTLNMKWWLDINTTYGGGALQDANVNVFDKNNVLQLSGLTDSNGKLKKALIEYTQYNNTNITYLSFYNVIINKSGYTSYSNSSVNMTTNLFINTALNFIPTTPILISPADTQALATNYAVLTYNSTDADNATDTLTFYVYNSTDNSYFSLLFSGSGWGNTSYNWSNLADDDYYWKVKAGDGKNNSSNSTSYKFTISSTTPAITLNYPTPNKYFNTRNISYFNFTAVDPDGLSMCILYHNLGDSWLINQSTTTASNNVMFSFNQTDLLTDEHNYIWNVWCNDTANNGGFASSNFTFHVDSAYPIMNITKITTTAGSQTISFDVDYTDYSISSCKYSIYDSDGDIDGLYNNISVTCESTGNPATVSGYATYTLRLYGKDTAGNENSTNLSFTTSQISVTPISPTGGGGTTIITECVKDADCSKYGEKYKCIQGKCIYQEFEEVCNYNNVCEPERGENFRNCGDELVNNTEMIKGDCHPLNLADLGKLAKSSQIFVWIVLILIVLGSTYFYQTRPKSFYQRKLKPYFAKKRRKI